MPSPEIKEEQSVKEEKMRRERHKKQNRDMQQISFKNGLVNNVNTIAITLFDSC